MKTCDNLVMTSPKWEIIVYKYQINTTQSLKYKISTSLFIYCCTSSLASWMLYYLVQLDVQWIWCSGVPSALSNAGTKTENIWQRIYAYLNRWSICVGLVTWITWERPVAFIWPHFKPTGKKTLSVPHSPSEIYLLHTSLPLGISVTLRGGGGGGMDIFWSHTIYKTKAVENIFLQEKFLFLLTLYPELALTGFWTTQACLQQEGLTWSCNPIENQHLFLLVSGQCQKTLWP